jgi:hypothetical protein
VLACLPKYCELLVSLIIFGMLGGLIWIQILQFFGAPLVLQIIMVVLSTFGLPFGLLLLGINAGQKTHSVPEATDKTTTPEMENQRIHRHPNDYDIENLNHPYGGGEDITRYNRR